MSLTREEAIIAMVQDGVEVQHETDNKTLHGVWRYTKGIFSAGINFTDPKEMYPDGYEIYTPPPKMVTKYLFSYRRTNERYEITKNFYDSIAQVSFHTGFAADRLTKLEWSATEFPV